MADQYLHDIDIIREDAEPRKLAFDIDVARYGGDYGGFSGWLF